MSEESNKSSIFLSIVIVFLLIAMGVYGFIYRDKLTEFFQKFQKKNEQVEKHTLYNNNSLSEKDSQEVSPESAQENNQSSSVAKTPMKEEAVDTSKKEIEEMVYGNVPGDDYSQIQPQPKKQKKPKVLDFEKNVPELSKETKPLEGKSKLAFVSPNSKKSMSSKKGKKRKYSKSKKSGTKKNGLLGRVSRLERALGIKAGKKEKLEKRIERLEKALKKQ
jgi:FtsZ-interacting cell division protein ZipA